MVESMVENIVDQACMYAKHRSCDTLEKEDVSFAVSQLFPEVARENKSPNLQYQIDHQVFTQFPLLINQGCE